MDKLPRELLVPERPKVSDLKVGEGAWVNTVNADLEGIVYLRKSKETFDAEYREERLFRARRVRVDKTETGWKVKIPRDQLPMKPKNAGLLKPICYVVDEIEIVD
jgi:hypothetical protein